MGPITPFITIVGAHLVTTYCTTSNWDDPPVVPVLGAPHPYIHYPYFIQMVHSMGFSGAPKNGIPYPYYSHTTPIRIPKDMGMVWEAYHKGVPLLGVPGITLLIHWWFIFKLYCSRRSSTRALTVAGLNQREFHTTTNSVRIHHQSNQVPPHQVQSCRNPEFSSYIAASSYCKEILQGTTTDIVCTVRTNGIQQTPT